MIDRAFFFLRLPLKSIEGGLGMGAELRPGEAAHD
jgi:hypothetical protein